MSTLTYIFSPQGVQLYPRDLSPANSRPGSRQSIRPPAAGSRKGDNSRAYGDAVTPKTTPAGRRAGTPAGSRAGSPQVERSVSPAWGTLGKNLTFEPTLLWDPSKPYKGALPRIDLDALAMPLLLLRSCC